MRTSRTRRQDAALPAERVEFRPSRFMVFLGFFGCLAFVMIALYLLLEVGAESWADLAALGFSLVFFGAGLIVSAWALLSQTPRLVVAESGLVLPGAGGEVIPWDAITGLDLYKIGRQRGLGLRLREPQRFVRSDGALGRFMDRLNRAQGYHISIALTGVKGGPKEIERTIRRLSGQRFPA